jgi:hypothetical protein
MQKGKLKNVNLAASIDTLSIISPQAAQIDTEVEYLNDIKTIKGGRFQEERYQYIINPNNTVSGELSTYGEYLAAIHEILAEMGITMYYKNRVDFRIDSKEDNFNELLKLNKCIILLLSMKYDVKNRYQSYDPLSLENLTIRIQNKYFEAENYNKAYEEPGGVVKNRLELRSKSMRKDYCIPELIEKWSKRLDDLPKYYDILQDKCNTELAARWQKEKGNRAKGVFEFVRKYQDNIFCRRQLINFFRMTGEKDPVKSADNFKQNNRIEYFSLKDIEHYIKMVSQALNLYCSKTLLEKSFWGEPPKLKS